VVIKRDRDVSAREAKSDVDAGKRNVARIFGTSKRSP